MKILIDTNIMLDILLAREPFLKPAKTLLHMVEQGQIQAFVTANSITDIVYVARKTYSPDEIRDAILIMLEQIDVIDVSRKDIVAAFDLGFHDFEDALQSSCVQRQHMDYIVTRNTKDFAKLKIPAIDLPNFISMKQE